MSSTAALCLSYRKELLTGGVHAVGDTYKMALYTDTATNGSATAAYSSTNEVSGTGYTAGGKALTGAAVTDDADVALLDFADPVWATATITAYSALIYNSSKSNKAVAVVTFSGPITSTGADFTVTLPVAAAATATIRLN